MHNGHVENAGHAENQWGPLEIYDSDKEKGAGAMEVQNLASPRSSWRKSEDRLGKRRKKTQAQKQLQLLKRRCGWKDCLEA